MDDEKSRRQEEQRRERQTARAQPDAPQGTGVQSVVDAVRDVEFPATRVDLMREAGERPVRPSQDMAMPLSAVLDRLDEDEFRSLREFQSALQRHWDEE